MTATVNGRPQATVSGDSPPVFVPPIGWRDPRQTVRPEWRVFAPVEVPHVAR